MINKKNFSDLKRKAVKLKQKSEKLERYLDLDKERKKLLKIKVTGILSIIVARRICKKKATSKTGDTGQDLEHQDHTKWNVKDVRFIIALAVCEVVRRSFLFRVGS